MFSINGDVMESIFKFKCPIKLIRKLYEEKHKENHKFSYNMISKKLGYKSRTGFSHIIKGNKKLTKKDIRILGELFELHGKALDFFRLLIKERQASSDEERIAIKQQLRLIRPEDQKILYEKDHHFYKNWLNTAVRNVLACGEFKINSYKDIASQFVHLVTEEEIEEVIEYLSKHDFIEENNDGLIKSTKKIIRTNSKYGTKELDGYHKEMIKQALAYMDKSPINFREYNTLSFSVSKDSIGEIKDQLRICRQNIIDIISEEKNADTVFHLNMQLLPITIIKES